MPAQIARHHVRDGQRRRTDRAGRAAQLLPVHVAHAIEARGVGEVGEVPDTRRGSAAEELVVVTATSTGCSRVAMGSRRWRPPAHVHERLSEHDGEAVEEDALTATEPSPRGVRASGASGITAPGSGPRSRRQIAPVRA